MATPAYEYRTCRPTHLQSDRQLFVFSYFTQYLLWLLLQYIMPPVYHLLCTFVLHNTWRYDGPKLQTGPPVVIVLWINPGSSVNKLCKSIFCRLNYIYNAHQGSPEWHISRIYNVCVCVCVWMILLWSRIVNL